MAEEVGMPKKIVLSGGITYNKDPDMCRDSKLVLNIYNKDPIKKCKRQSDPYSPPELRKDLHT
jgi:hypothetical protein